MPQTDAVNVPGISGQRSWEGRRRALRGEVEVTTERADNSVFVAGICLDSPVRIKAGVEPKHKVRSQMREMKENACPFTIPVRGIITAKL